jgi:short-subunit dehydrogenase
MVSSVNARLPDPLVLNYSAVKAALASVAKSLSKELGKSLVAADTSAATPGPIFPPSRSGWVFRCG